MGSLVERGRNAIQADENLPNIPRDAVTLVKKEPAVWIHVTGAKEECKRYPGNSGHLPITPTARGTVGYCKNRTGRAVT